LIGNKEALTLNISNLHTDL